MPIPPFIENWKTSILGLAAIVAVIAKWVQAGQVDFSDINNLIGIIAGIVVCAGVLFNDHVTKIDDPCGAISVHGFCGLLGGICVGIFADGSYGAGWNGKIGRAHV